LKEINLCLKKYSAWSRQGVLMLNVVLTVRQAQANSHKKQVLTFLKKEDISNKKRDGKSSQMQSFEKSIEETKVFLSPSAKNILIQKFSVFNLF